MTALLVGTFTVSGIHTLLWFPRALQMRRELRAAEAAEAEAEKHSGKTASEAKDGDDAPQ
jgi:hypothetical protein